MSFMEEPGISVLVTFYNQEKYVDAALSGIMKQVTDLPIHVIIGDDGSTDHTRERIFDWIKRYPEAIELHVMERLDGELSAAGFRASRNRLHLLQFVNTKFFIFLDGDDYYEYNHKLQRQVEILERPENQECIACGHNCDMLYPDGHRVPISSTTLKEGIIDPKTYWGQEYFHTDSMLIRSKIIPLINKELLENNFNDNLITFSIIQHGSLYYIPESWVVYLQTGDGIWTSGKKIINLIRNLFAYDICNKINPRMKKETTMKYSYAWFELIKARNGIEPNELASYVEEAKKRQLKCSLKWLNYARLNIFFKFTFLLKACFVARKNIFKALKSKIKKKIWHRLLQTFYLYGLKKSDKKVPAMSLTLHSNDLSAYVAPVYHCKSGIVTIISDDGDYETGMVLDDLSKRYNIPITIAGTVANIAKHIRWWKKCTKNNSYIEIVNHSYNHIRMDEINPISKKKHKLKHEIIHSSMYFEKRFGKKQITFVCPENQMCASGYDIIEKSDIKAVRKGVRGYNDIYPGNQLEPGDFYNLKCVGIMDYQNTDRQTIREGWIKSVVEDKKWLIEMWHNVNNDTLKGYQTIAEEEAINHIEYIKQVEREGKLWVAKFSDVIKYFTERDHACISSIYKDGEIIVSLGLNDSAYQTKVYDFPLTICIDLPTEMLKQIDRKKIDYIYGNQICFDLKPGEIKRISLDKLR